MMLDALPLTQNGKVDRKALPEPGADGAAAQAYVAPRTQTEQLLSELWSDVLKLPRIGAQDDFFELGGHSLLATQLISRIRRCFDIELPLRSLFEQPTIAALAPLVDAARARGDSIDAPPLTPAPRDDSELPLSFAQQRLWFLDQLEPDSGFYNMAASLRLRGALREDALDAALRALMLRHEALRTRFPASDGAPIQSIASDADVVLRHIDLRALAHDARDAQMKRLVEDEAQRPFDLSRGPLLRALLIALDEDEHALAFVLHHIVSDGWSIDILIRDVAESYTAFVEQRESKLAPLPIQYADYACWQRLWLQGDALQRQISYWRDTLAGAPPALELPTDHPRPATQSYRGARLSFTASAEVTRRLKSLGRAADATLFMTLLAAFDVLLMRYSGQQDLCVGSPVANRTRLETEELIGVFVNTLVLRGDLSGDPRFVDLLARLRETVLDAQAHQDAPFERLVEELQPTRDPSRNPLFQTMFVLQNAPQRRLDLPGLTIEAMPIEMRSAQFDLTLAVTEQDEMLAGELEYNIDLFDEATIARMARHFGVLLEAIAEDPELRLSELPLLDAAERRLLTVEWNDLSTIAPQSRCLHEIFEAQAALRRMPWRRSMARRSSRTASWSGAPIGSRIIFALWASGRRHWWRCAWIARSI